MRRTVRSSVDCGGRVQRCGCVPFPSVYPHAWRATLGGPNGKRMAVASGMAYVPPRFCRAYDFLSTADEVSDSDIMLVRALLDQFPARFGMGLDTGVAFLCVWERNPAAPKGAGAVVLQAGLNALKQCLRKVTALVVDLRPLQFNDWDLPNEPAEIATAKQEAREKLHTLLDSLDNRAITGVGVPSEARTTSVSRLI